MSWKCKKCGRDKGDMKLLGKGMVQCPGCWTVYFVQPNGELVVVK